ncbi:MAG: SiaB family protein kinase [Bacteroidales bacterium]|nr:SiaB family protein kinase [Bacteroidales bacterium]
MTLKEKYILYSNYVINIIKGLGESEVILMYEGEVNHEIIKTLIYTLECNLKRTNLSRILQKKVFCIIVEVIQNIEKHYYNLSFKKGAILVIHNKESIIVITGNKILKEQYLTICEYEKKIKGKSKEEIRKMFLKQLENGTLNNKGGAGLGFLYLARKSNNNLTFYFEDLSDNFYNFILKVELKKFNVHEKV